MAEVTFEVAGKKYRADPMDARMQFHVATKFAAVLSAFSAADDKLSAIGDALSRLKPDDADFVINACLGVVKREIEGGAGWTPVLAPNGLIMFDDVRTSLAALMQLVIPVVRANIEGFLSELPKDFLAKLIAGARSTSI